MITTQPNKTGLHISLKPVALVVVLAGIHVAADIIMQLLLAFFSAIVSNPFVTQSIRRGIGHPIAITLIVVVMLIALAVLVSVLASSVAESTDLLPKYNKGPTCKVLYLQEMVPFLNLHMSPEHMLQCMDSGKLMTLAITLMMSLSSAMASIFPLVVTVVFMLFEVRYVLYRVRFMLNNPQIHIAGLYQVLRGMSHYLVLKALLSLRTDAIIWLGLALMGIQFAPMQGALAFLLNYVPNIDSTISVIPPMIQTLLFNGTYEYVLVGVPFPVVHMVIGSTLEPRMVGHRLELSTLIVFPFLSAWGWLLGPVDMPLSVPLTSVCRVWMETTTGGSKLAILLGSGGPKS